MFWNKKKRLVSKVDYKKYVKKFEENKTDKKEKEDYEDIQILYNNIKSFYYTQIKSKQLKVNIEKVRLESETGKYLDPFNIQRIGLFIAICAVIFTLYLQGSNIFNFHIKYFGDSVSNIINASLGAVTFIILICCMGKNLYSDKDKKQNMQFFINSIRLKVLDDIEKEIAEEQIRKKEEADKLEKRQWIEQRFNRGNLFKRKFINVEDEIGATIIDKDDKEKIINYPIRVINGFINIVMNKNLNR
ncbi:MULTISPECIES: hypothetical protein [Clostridium]|uniref:SMODS and SLOG-associating 2TM effector domain-containing protein n=1 Tax=Clostridium frigoriphilum TaxID=443253 RepID=A0ABU7UV25_9CLOT|nr:hypothetical protein [Clostridium sp. DSM 17811]MBU3102237.1 hypothetical protein [Clostridium sp. DSM 17811]